MNRRTFLASLAAAVAGAALDPERLLWTPGAKTVFVPPPSGWVGIDWGTLGDAHTVINRFHPGDIITIEGKFARNPITREETAQLQHFMVVAVNEGRMELSPNSLLTEHRIRVRPAVPTEPDAAAEYFYRGDRFPRQTWAPPLKVRDRRHGRGSRLV